MMEEDEEKDSRFRDLRMFEIRYDSLNEDGGEEDRNRDSVRVEISKLRRYGTPFGLNAIRRSEAAASFESEEEEEEEAEDAFDTLDILSSVSEYARFHKTMVHMQRHLRCSANPQPTSSSADLDIFLETCFEKGNDENSASDSSESPADASILSSEIVDWQYLRPVPSTSRDARFTWFAGGRRSLHNRWLARYLPEDLLVDWKKPCVVYDDGFNPLKYMSIGHGRDGFRPFRSNPSGFATVLAVACGVLDVCLLHREDAEYLAGLIDVGIDALPDLVWNAKKTEIVGTMASASDSADGASAVSVDTTTSTTDASSSTSSTTYAPSTLRLIRRAWCKTLRKGDTLVLPAGTFFSYRYANPCLVGRDGLNVWTTCLRLDVANVSRLFQSFVDRKTVGIAHRQMIWNAAHGVMLRARKAATKWRKHCNSSRASSNDSRSTARGGDADADGGRFSRQATPILDSLFRLKTVAQAYVNTDDSSMWSWRLLVGDLAGTHTYFDSFVRYVLRRRRSDGGDDDAIAAKEKLPRAPRLRSEAFDVPLVTLDLNKLPREQCSVNPPRQLQHQKGRIASTSSTSQEKEVYFSKNNETPKMIAKAFGVDVSDLVRENASRFDGFTASARLRQGTEVVIPRTNLERLLVDVLDLKENGEGKGEDPNVAEKEAEGRKRRRKVKDERDDVQHIPIGDITTYVAKNNETPRQIATNFGVDVRLIVQLNRARFKGFQADAKLKERTNVLVPTLATAAFDPSSWNARVGTPSSKTSTVVEEKTAETTASGASTMFDADASSTVPKTVKKTSRKSCVSSRMRVEIENPTDLDHRQQLESAKIPPSDEEEEDNVSSYALEDLGFQPDWSATKLIALADRMLSTNTSTDPVATCTTKAKRRKKKKKKRKKKTGDENDVKARKKKKKTRRVSISTPTRRIEGERQSKRLRTDWSCGLCSLRNPGRRSKCQVCGASRSQRVREVETSVANGEDTTIVASNGVIVRVKNVVEVAWAATAGTQRAKSKEARVVQILPTTFAVKVRYEEWNSPEYDEYHPNFCVKPKLDSGGSGGAVGEAPRAAPKEPSKGTAVYVRPAVDGSKAGVHAYSARVVDTYRGPLLYVTYPGMGAEWNQWLPPTSVKRVLR
eukprot:g5064.t1